MLPGDNPFIFGVGPFRTALGIRDDDDGEGGGSDDIVARDAAHADILLSEGYQAGRIVDWEKALAGIKGIRQYKPSSYNNSSRLHSTEASLLDGDGRDMECFDLDSYNGVPGVHLLIKDIEMRWTSKTSRRVRRSSSRARPVSARRGC